MPKTSSLNNRHVLCHSSGGQKYKVKCPPAQWAENQSVPGLSPGMWALALRQQNHTITWHPPHPVCTAVSKCPLLARTPATWHWEGPTLMAHLHLTICKVPLSRSHSEVLAGRVATSTFLGETAEPIKQGEQG